MIYRVCNFVESKINPITNTSYDDTWVAYCLTDAADYQMMLGNNNSVHFSGGFGGSATLLQGHNYRDSFLRENEPGVLVHSATYENWLSIKEDGMPAGKKSDWTVTYQRQRSLPKSLIGCFTSYLKEKYDTKMQFITVDTHIQQLLHSIMQKG